jgi:pimeloyl-ACP methyl ester carboxylesterase
MRRLRAITIAVALALAGCSSSGSLTLPTTRSPGAVPSATSDPAPTPAPPQSTGLRWEGCQGDFECATLSVPLDHDQPGGRRIELALIRAAAGDASGRIGSLLLNPGGPGASTVDFFEGLVGQLSDRLKERFDVVGFDPRGVGHSTAVDCLDGPGLDELFAVDPGPTDDAGRRRLYDAQRAFARACQQRSGDLLEHVGTRDAARDMDLLRAALGDDKTTYLGFSYGTLLGATYADLFPTRVRALVLDGAVDPSLPPLRSSLVQARGFQRQLEAFARDCDTGSGCAYDPDGRVLDGVRRLLARVTDAPLEVGDRRLGPGEAFIGVAAALYSRDGWDVLAQALEDAESGDGQLMLRLADSYTERERDGSYSNLLEANAAINCIDEAWPRDLADYERVAREAVAVAPDFGRQNVLGGSACAFWPVPPVGRTGPIRAAGSPPLVVVGTTGDPATPYEEAQAMADQLERGVLLTRVGDGHTAYGESACIDAVVDNYLVDLTVPADGTTCRS